MPKTEAQLRANKKYLENFEQIKLRTPKGYKEKIIRHIDEHTNDKSINAFLKRAIDETIKNDTLK